MKAVDRQASNPTAQETADLAMLANRQKLQRRETENRTITKAIWQAKQ